VSVPAWTGERAALSGRVREFFWAHPEWWCVAVSAAAWAAMLQHGLHGHGACHARQPPGREWLQWMEMIAAMMLPLVLGSVRAAGFRSLRARRHRAIGLFLLGYLAPWGLLGVAVIGLRALDVTGATHTHAAAAVAFALASAWMIAPAHRRALAACHRSVPMAPSGWRADVDALRFGASVGLACMVSCWAVMVACAITGHGLPAMIGGAAIGVLERRAFRPRIRAAAAATLLLSVGYAVAALA
jgi:predicted metal-binding membrane protein